MQTCVLFLLQQFYLIFGKLSSMLFHYFQSIYLINYKNETNVFGVSIKFEFLNHFKKNIYQTLIEHLVLYNTFMNFF